MSGENEARLSQDHIDTCETNVSGNSENQEPVLISGSTDKQEHLLTNINHSMEDASNKCDFMSNDQSESSSDTSSHSKECIKLSEVSQPTELVEIKIIYNKHKFDYAANMNMTIKELKKVIEKMTGVPVETQKVVFKGSTQDEQSLRDLKVTKNSKFMVIGSTMTDLLKITPPSLAAAARKNDETDSSDSKQPLCKQAAHKKVLEKHGKPEDLMPGLKEKTMPLPSVPLTGMYNKYGSKTRLTFKLDQDEVWIGTKERTQKLKLGSIKSVLSESIESHDEYHIMGLQLGTTEASYYWIYWVPAQYVDAIKDTILGKWQMY